MLYILVLDYLCRPLLSCDLICHLGPRDLPLLVLHEVSDLDVVGEGGAEAGGGDGDGQAHAGVVVGTWKIKARFRWPRGKDHERWQEVNQSEILCK